MISPVESLSALLDMALSALSTWKPRPDIYLTANGNACSLPTLEMLREETLYVKFRDLIISEFFKYLDSSVEEENILPLKPPIIYDIFIKPISLLASVPSRILNVNLCKALMFDNILLPSLCLDPSCA